jgi:predicted RNase H-like nuclease (RuvC/YqgF family)
MKCQISKYEKEIEHLKQIYKNLFDSIKRSRVQTQNSNLKQQETDDLKSQLYEFADKKFENVLQKIESMKKKNVDFQITKVSFPKPLFDSNTPDF